MNGREKGNTKSWQRYFCGQKLENKTPKSIYKMRSQIKLSFSVLVFFHSARMGYWKKLLLVTVYAECYRFRRKPPFSSIFQYNGLSLCGVVMLSNNICTQSHGQFIGVDSSSFFLIRYWCFSNSILPFSIWHPSPFQSNSISFNNWWHDERTDVQIFNSILNFNVLFQTDCYCFQSPNEIKVIF